MSATTGIYRCQLLPVFTDVSYYGYLPMSVTTGIDQCQLLLVFTDTVVQSVV